MSAPLADDAASGWTEIQTLVDEIAELTESETSADRFHDEALRRLCEVTAATEATAWTAADGTFAVARRVGGNGSADDSPDPGLFGRVLAGRRAVRVDAADTSAGPTDPTRALCSVFAGDEPVGLLEIVQPAETTPASRRASTQLLEAVAELVGDFHRNRLLAVYRDRERDWEAHRAFCRRIFEGGSLREVGFAVANEGREYLDVGRLSVLERRGSQWRTIAVSGASRVESRARQVRRLEALVATVLAAETEFVHIDGQPPSEAYPPQIVEALESYLDESNARFVQVRRLDDDAREASPIRFALVAESFEASGTAAAPERMRRIAPDARRALEAARPPSFAERLVSGRVAWTVCGLILVASVLLAVVPADFTVPARGTIEPANQNRIFAPRSGFVRQLRTQYGKKISAGAVVVELHDPDLDLELQDVEGELQKVALQLAAAEIARLPGAPETANDPSAMAEELEKVQASLRERRELLEAERRKLTVESPAAGRVVTWDLERRLRSRPVRRGDLLLEVADVDGPWRLRLDVPDDEFGHVRAVDEGGGELRIEYALATEPERPHNATITRLARTTEVNADGESIVRAEVTLAAAAVPEARPGATVVARIHCGRRSLGYVWFHEALHAARVWWYR